MIENRAWLDQQYAALYQMLAADEHLAFWLETLPQQIETLTFTKPHGKRQLWLDTLAALPELAAADTDFTQGRVRIGQPSDCNDAERAELKQQLEVFIPWRKGPFELFGIHIDTEWRSDWKWQRVVPHLSPLTGRRILDVGCGSGYHLWRMLGEGAAQVIGIDPSLFFLMQFHSIKHYVPDAPVHFLPLRSEDLPDFSRRGFDTVFSMGVLYHRRSPLEHLQELRNSLCAGGAGAGNAGSGW